jgi:hypothetical protein
LGTSLEHLSGAPLYGRLLALPTNISLESLAWDKQFSLSQTFVNYDFKKFLTLRPGHYVLKTFYGCNLRFFYGRLLALPTNISLGWKALPGTKTLVYYKHL